jgi:PAS domain S-box-containing protein
VIEGYNVSELQLAIPLIIAAEAAVALAVVGLWRRGIPGSVPFSVLMAAAAWCSVAVSMSLLSDSAGVKFTWLRIQFVGSVFVPAAWLALVFQFGARRTALPDRLLGLLAVEPLIMLVLVWTNGVHGLFWTQVQLDPSLALPLLDTTGGAMFWLHNLYSLGAVGVGIGLLVTNQRNRQAVLRRQSFVVAGAGGLILLGMLLTLSGVFPHGIDATPMATLIGGAAVGAALFRYRILSLIPIARDAVMEGMTEGAVILDEAGHVVDMNPAAERITGSKVDTSVGLPATELLSAFGDVGNDVALPYINWAEVPGQLGPRHYELRMSRLYKAETKSRGRLVVIRDVTAQKEAEAELHQTVARVQEDFETQTGELTQELQERKFAEIALKDSEERARQVVDTAYDAFVAMNANGAIIDWNPRADVIFGYKREESLGKDFASHLLPARTREEHRRGLRYFLASGEWPLLNRQVELAAMHADGREFEAEMTMSPGIVNGVRVFNAFIHDITERKHAEQALRDSNFQLEKALTELETAQQQVIQQERLRALGQMASGIAHEFNNALSPIMGFSELLMVRPNILADQTKAKRYLEGIRTAAQDAAHVVSRLREFYRARQTVDDSEPIELNALISQTVALTQPKWRGQAQANGVSVRVNTDLNGQPLIAGDASSLREVLTNLIFNAVDAMSDGGRVLIHTGEENGRAIVQVADNGSGMPEEVIKRCLDPFFSTKGEKGTGLGLSLVHGIVERHGGTMDIQSQVGKGTVFTLDFPLTEAVAPVAVVADTGEFDGRKLKLLAVDDDRAVLEVIEAILQADGHDVVVANSAREGLEELAKDAKDLVLTDLAMPLMNGDKFAQVVKRMHPGTPVVLLTGFAEMLTDSEFSSSVDIVLSKPVSPAKLREAFEQVLPPPAAAA